MTRASTGWLAKVERAASGPLPRVVATIVVLAITASRWDPVTGYTALMRFGERYATRRLPALRTLPIASSPGDGYDGQWYAQLAVEPRVTSSEVAGALDNPAYRARRILMPLVAHVLGGGDPWRVLQLYALLHMAAWLALAMLWWRIIPATDWRANAGWLGALLGTGALDSMKMTLTDLPAAVLLVLAAMAAERGRPRWTVFWMLAAGFTRELSLAGAFMIRDDGRSGAEGGADGAPADSRRAWWRTLGWRAAAVAPVIAWALWLALHLPGNSGLRSNFDWPGVAFASRLWQNMRLVGGGEGGSQQWFGVVGGVGLAAQSVFVLRDWRRFRSVPWVALGIPFAVLFWVIGADPWIDYRAVARACLPMTLVFNLLWVRRTEASALWLLANVPVIDGVLRLTWP